MLPPAPPTMLDGAGRACVGAYQGPLPPVALGARFEGVASRTFRRKRWLFTSIAAGEWLFGSAVVHLGYLAKGFAYAYHAGRRETVATKTVLAPTPVCHVAESWEPGASASISFSGLDARLAASPGGDELRVAVGAKGLDLAATLDLAGAPPPLAVIVHPDGDEALLNANEKRLLLPTRGVAVVQGERVSLDGGFAAYDYTHGVLPRRTRWRWASLAGRATCGRAVGLNLVEGFNGEVECAAWLDGALVPVGEASFAFDRDRPKSPWRVTTRGGAVDLTLDVGDLHEETTNFKLVAARFTQALGRYSGTITLPGHAPLTLDGVLGVAEDQDTLW